MEKAEVIIFDWTGTLYERNQGLFSFTKDILDKLKPKYKLGLISKAKNIDKRKQEIENSGIAHYFDLIKVANAKNPEILNGFLNKFGVEREKIVVIGDRASRDIWPGNELGCTTIWIQRGDRSFDPPNKETGEPNHRIDSIKELLDIF